MGKRKNADIPAVETYPIFTREMKQTHTILVPQMAPIHMEFLVAALRQSGYKVELLTNDGPEVVTTGLKYVHNDTCYPALLVIGQMINALDSGKYDLDHTALVITQTGGGCRASNYIYLLRKALKKAGYGNVPVASLNFSGLEKGSGFKLNIPTILKMVSCLFYGDELMLLANQIRPYEVNSGDTDALLQKWIKEICDLYAKNKGITLRELTKNFERIAKSFSEIPVNRVPKVKVGIVGEIYVKYSPLGNNQLEEFLAKEGCEVNVPGLLGFCMYCLVNRPENIDLYGGSKLMQMVYQVLFNYVEKRNKRMIAAIEKYPDLRPPELFAFTKSCSEGVISRGTQMGEGWLLTAEMVELEKSGFSNIVCTQPFGCLPNHICAKGMMNKIRELYPDANVVAIDYDPSATRVNQENRIKLMLSIARENLARKEEKTDKNADKEPVTA